MADFDRFATGYRSTLDRSVSLSGEESAYFADYKAAYAERLLGRPASRILDFGCGIGALSSALSRRFPDARIDGFDVSSESVQRVAPDLKSRGTFTDSTTDLRDDYDLVVVSNVLHHVERCQRAALIADLADRLAGNGSLLVIEHNPLNPATRWVVRHCEFDDGVSLLWPSEVRGYLRTAGLGPARRDYIVFFPKVLAALRRFEPWLAWCPAGAQYAIAASKTGGPAGHR